MKVISTEDGGCLESELQIGDISLIQLDKDGNDYHLDENNIKVYVDTDKYYQYEYGG